VSDPVKPYVSLSWSAEPDAETLKHYAPAFAKVAQNWADEIDIAAIKHCTAIMYRDVCDVPDCLWCRA